MIGSLTSTEAANEETEPVLVKVSSFQAEPGFPQHVDPVPHYAPTTPSSDGIITEFSRFVKQNRENTYIFNTFK